MGLDERVHGVAVPNRVDDRSAGIAEGNPACAGGETGGEALVRRRSTGIRAPAEEKEYLDNKTS